MGDALIGGFVCPAGVGTSEGSRLGTGEGCADSDGRELGKFSCVGPGLVDGFADGDIDGCWLTGLAVRRVGLGVGADPPPPDGARVPFPLFVPGGPDPDFPPFPDCSRYIMYM